MFKAIRFISLMVPLLLLAACANLQVVPTEERQLQKVNEINLSKNEIFDKTLEWMALSFNDFTIVIELKDKENGKIIGKGITNFTNVIVSIPCRYTMIVEIKDNKYRTTYNSFVGLWGEFHNNPRDVEEKVFIDEIKIKINALDNSLNSF